MKRMPPLAEPIDVIDLGRRPFRAVVDVQREVLEAVIEGRRPSTLIFVEHEPVLTLGAGFRPENLLLSVSEYEARGIEVVRTDRGGDVTFHAPGQLVAYPIFRLDFVDRDLHRWLRLLEEVVIGALGGIGLAATRNSVNTGVWVENRKICAIGIKVRRWVSMHGLALNCDLDLAPYDLFVPCGIRGDFGVTSISRELGRSVTVDDLKPRLASAFRELGGHVQLSP